MSDEFQNPLLPEEEVDEQSVLAEKHQSRNEYFRNMMDRNFLEYASYVIGSRAIPDVDDGLKPVQRRILWSLYKIYENGRTTKTANVVGNTMHFHPHGDASIGDALVNLANKGGCIEQEEYDPRTQKKRMTFVSVPYYIKKQGNFGNILSGSRAAASRYTECALTRMAYETLFNNDITELVPNYDGRELEPVTLPAKLPSLLMLGSDGIAVGMSTMVLPHNFNELIDAEIAELKGEPFKLYPDFQQGGLMDVREYDDGNGKIVLRAKIDVEGKDLIIREIPAVCTSQTLAESIEKAWKKNKIKISSVVDYTTDRVELRVTTTRGYDAEKTRQALYMYTDCSVSISPKLVVICDRKPVQMTVTQVLKRNVQKLLSYFKKEFEIALERQYELRHAKTLAQLFFENRIYKRIEECASAEEEYTEVLTGLAPFRDQLLRDVTKEDVDKLLSLPVRRIARFDIEKNQQELRAIADEIKQIKHHLSHLTEYAIRYLEEMKKRYGSNFPRRTEIENLEQIDRTKAALNNIKVGWDRKNGYIGTAVKADPDDTITCNEFDNLLCVEKSGTYKIIQIPDKLFVGKLFAFRRHDPTVEFGVIYRESKGEKFYAKRSIIDKFIRDKEYHLCPENCKLELLTPCADAIYELIETKRLMPKITELNLLTTPLRAPKARGVKIGSEINKITKLRALTEEESAQFRAADAVAAGAEEEEKVASTSEASISDTPFPEEAKQPGDSTNTVLPENTIASEQPQAESDTFGITQPELGF